MICGINNPINATPETRSQHVYALCILRWKSQSPRMDQITEFWLYVDFRFAPFSKEVRSELLLTARHAHIDPCWILRSNILSLHWLTALAWETNSSLSNGSRGAIIIIPEIKWKVLRPEKIRLVAQEKLTNRKLTPARTYGLPPRLRCIACILQLLQWSNATDRGILPS